MKILRPITFLVLAGGALALGAVPVQADGAAANDNLNATLWTQSSVEFKANALGMYKLAELMLDRALADKSWTAAPGCRGAEWVSQVTGMLIVRLKPPKSPVPLMWTTKVAENSSTIPANGPPWTTRVGVTDVRAISPTILVTGAGRPPSINVICGVS